VTLDSRVADPDNPDDLVGIHDIVTGSGMNPRRIDYATRRRWLHATAAGSGHPRRWPRREVTIARIMLRLENAGLKAPTAANLARRYVENRYSTGLDFLPDARVVLGPGLVLEIDSAVPPITAPIRGDLL
jgi:hypothetical protein